MSKLKPHPIPDAALDADIAILGKKGRGKTFTAKGLVERLLQMQRRVLVLDPLSVWWGLKSGADGKSPGFPIPVFGGPHADIPLHDAAGPIIGELITSAAKNAGRLKQELKKYSKPALLILDELGYLPIDKAGADLLFQVISLRYEQGAIIITSNRAFKEWPTIFNNDSTLTAAILDRLLHHAETVIIEGKSCRMKDQIEG